MACDPKITYKGKQYTYAEFMAMLEGGLMDMSQLRDFVDGKTDVLNLNKDYAPKFEGAKVDISEKVASIKDVVLESGEGKVEKTMSQRLKESSVDDVVKNFFSLNNMRAVDSFDIAEANAQKIISELGMDGAYESAVNNEVDGALKSAIMHAKWLDLETQIKATSDLDLKLRLQTELTQVLNQIEKEQSKSGSFGGYAKKFYADNPDLGLSTDDKIKRWEGTASGGAEAAPAEIVAKYKELEKKEKEYLAKVEEFKQKQAEFEMQQIIDAVKSKGEPKKDPQKATKKAKEIADEFRKALKSKPIELKGADGKPLLGADGKPIVLKMQGLDFNELVELGAKAIETTGKVIDGIKAVAEKLSEQDWYKSLSKNDKEAVLGQIKSIYESSDTETRKAKSKAKKEASKEEDKGKTKESGKQESEEFTSDMLKELIEEGYDTPELLLKKVKEFYPNKSEREVRDSITKYGKPQTETASDIDKQLSAIKSIFVKDSQLEDVKSGKLPFKRQSNKNEFFTDERRRKMNEIKDILKTLDVPEANEAQWKTRKEAIKTKLKNAIADKLQAIADNEMIVNEKPVKLNDADIEQLKKELAIVNEQYEMAFGEPAMSAGELKIRALERKLESIGKEKDKEAKVEPEYTAAELIDIENLEREIEARRKAVNMEGATLKTAEEKNIERLQKKLDDLKQGIIPEKKTKRELSAEEQSIVDEINKEKEALGLTKPKRTEEEIRIDNIQKAITRVQSNIKNGDIELNKKQPKEVSDAIKAKQELYKDVLKELKEAREAAGIIEREKIKQRLDYLKKREAKLLERKANNDYSKAEKKKSPYTDEILTTLGRIDALKQEEARLQYLAEEKARRLHQKVGNLLWDIWNIPRIQMATGELSFIGVQGRRLMLAELTKKPKTIVEALKNMTDAIFSKEKFNKLQAEIKVKDPLLYHTMKASKVQLLETSGKMSAMEESSYRLGGKFIWSMMSYMVGKPIDKVFGTKVYDLINDKSVFEALERGAVAFGNYLRVKGFTDFYNLQKMSGNSIEKDPLPYKLYADYLNTASGRASLGKAEASAELLSKFFFSPRNAMTEFQLATTPLGIGKLFAMHLASGKPMTAQGFKEDKAFMQALNMQVRYTIASVLPALSATVLAYMKMGSTDDNEDGTGVELNPLNTNFGRIVYKNGKVVDLFNGQQRYFILSSRVATGDIEKPDKYKYNGKKVTFERGETKALGADDYTQTRLDLFLNIIGNKINPTFGTALRVGMAKSKNKDEELLGIKRDKYGKEVNYEEVAKELFTPIFWRSVGKSLENEPDIVDGLGQMAAFAALISYNVNNKEQEAIDKYNRKKEISKMAKEKIKSDKKKELEERRKKMGLIK